MTDRRSTSTDDAGPLPDPGERRRLAHPPSDRYRAAEAAAAAAEVRVPDPNATIARGVAVATVVAILGALAIVVLGGVLTLTDALLIVAGFSGFGIGVALRWGAGDRFGRPRERGLVALVLALGAIAAAQLGLWQYARIEGGVLGPLDYVGQVFGPLVLLEFAVAAIVAWLTAR